MRFGYCRAGQQRKVEKTRSKRIFKTTRASATWSIYPSPEELNLTLVCRSRRSRSGAPTVRC